MQQRGLLTLVGDLAFRRHLGVNAHGWWILPSSHHLQGMEAQSTGRSGTGFYCYNTNVATYLSKTGNNPKSKGIWISKQASVSAQECCKSRISWIPFLNNLISLFIYIYIHSTQKILQVEHRMRFISLSYFFSKLLQRIFYYNFELY